MIEITSNSKRVVLFLSFHLAFFVVYSMINSFLLEQGFLNPYLMYFGEKALLALRGIPPRLENIGFVYPPLPIYITCLFNGNVLLAQSFVGSMISGYILLQLLERMKSLTHPFLLIAYFIFSFPVLFLATQRFDLYLYFFLIMLSINLLMLYVRRDYSLYLFLAGPVFGLTFFTHFSSIYLIPAFLFLIVVTYRNNIKKAGAATLVFFAPYIIFLFIFTYVNWVFTSETFGFLKNYTILFNNPSLDAVTSAGNLIGSLGYMLNYLIRVLPIIAPCLLGMYLDRSLISVIPFMVILSFVYSNLLFPSVYAATIFIIHFFITVDFGKLVKARLLTIALLISLIAGPMLASVSSDRNEKHFVNAMLGTVGDNLDVYRKVEKILQGTEGYILVDDKTGYPLVYLMGKPQRFILPYQYEFMPALSNPSSFADYVVVFRNKDADALYQHFENEIKGFYRILDCDNVVVWERTRK